MQPTASKTALLLACQRPFAVESAPVEPNEAMRYGSAFHEAMYERIKIIAGPTHGVFINDVAVCVKWGIADVAALTAAVDDAFARLVKWLEGDNPWHVRFKVVGAERPLATRVRIYPKRRLRVDSRACYFDAATHTYDLRPGEIGGTYDLLVESHELGSGPRGLRVCLDYKTGDYGDFSSPADIPQMRTLALQTDSNVVAVMVASRGLPPVIYAEEISPKTLAEHARALRRAQKRIGDGSLTPGPQCARCPAREGCPAQDADLLKHASALVKASVEGPLAKPVELDLGRMHLLLSDLDKLAKRAREEIRARVQDGEVIERPDGKVLQMITKTYERLSKSSILEALGKKKGEAMLAKLRDLGCLTEETREEMWAK